MRPAGGPCPLEDKRSAHSGPGRTRIEFDNGQVLIEDHRQRTCIRLNPDKKLAVVWDMDDRIVVIDKGRIDAGASLEADTAALLSLGMLVFPVDARLWDDCSPIEILEKATSSKPGKPIMRGGCFNSDPPLQDSRRGSWHPASARGDGRRTQRPQNPLQTRRADTG